MDRNSLAARFFPTHQLWPGFAVAKKKSPAGIPFHKERRRKNIKRARRKVADSPGNESYGGKEALQITPRRKRERYRPTFSLVPTK